MSLSPKQLKQYQQIVNSDNFTTTYQQLMQYLQQVRNYMIQTYPDEFAVGSLYQGYMDVSYFGLTPHELKSQKLKIAVVFKHATLQFELWLVGQNKKVQKYHWEELKTASIIPYPITPNPTHAIITHQIAVATDFESLDKLTIVIEKEVVAFTAQLRPVFL